MSVTAEAVVTAEATVTTVTVEAAVTAQDTTQSVASTQVSTVQTVIDMAEGRIIAHVTKLIAEAVTDIRKGDANTVAKLSELTNAILSLKNTVLGLATALADIKKSPHGIKANVYVAKSASVDLPTDLFNTNPIEDASCD